MKRSFVFFCALMAGALSFSSCNKDLKDDINELKRDLGTDEPITVTTTYTDFKDVERKLTATCKYRGSSYSDDAMIKNEDGTYTIRIERYEGLASEQYVELEFDYDPTSKKITHKDYFHEWEDIGKSRGYLEIYEEDEPREGLTFNIDIKSIDLQAGTLNIDVKIEGSKAYSENYPWSVPNPNSAFSAAFSFNGKLSTYELDEMPD